VAANVFWIPGGDGIWTGATNWSLASGGANNASAPGSANLAVFDANSGTGTVTISSAGTCRGISSANFGGTFAGSSTLTSSSDIIIGTGVTWSYTGTLSLTGNLTTNGKTLNNLTLTGNCTLQDALTVTNGVTVNAGTFNLNAKAVSAGSLTIATASVKVLTVSGALTLTGGSNVWVESGSNFTTTITANVVSAQNVTVTNATITGSAASGGGTFDATGAGNVNGGGNSGWTFAASFIPPPTLHGTAGGMLTLSGGMQ
jgi:hypothetical protein